MKVKIYLGNTETNSNELSKWVDRSVESHNVVKIQVSKIDGCLANRIAYDQKDEVS